MELASVPVLLDVVIDTHNNGNKIELFCFKHIHFECFCLETEDVNNLPVCFAVLNALCCMY